MLLCSLDACRAMELPAPAYDKAAVGVEDTSASWSSYRKVTNQR